MTRLIATTDAEGYASKLIPPVTRSLQAIHLLNGTLEKAAHNYAMGQSDGSVIGAPVAQTGYVSFVGLSSFIQSSAQETASGTYFIVARSTSAMTTDANRPMFFGTFQSPAVGGGGNTFGVSMVATGTAIANAYASRGTSAPGSSAGTSVATPDTTDFTLYCLTIAANGATILRDLTNGLINQANPGTPRLVSTGRFRIGSGFMTYGGSCDAAYFEARTAVLTDEEITAQRDWIRDYLSSKGLAV